MYAKGLVAILLIGFVLVANVRCAEVRIEFYFCIIHHA